MIESWNEQQMPVANDVFFTPVFHLHDESPSPRHKNKEREQPIPKRQRPHHSGRLLGALWMIPASGTSLLAAGIGRIVRTPRTACKSLAGRPPPSTPPAPRPSLRGCSAHRAGARRSQGNKALHPTRESLSQPPPISAARTHKRCKPPRVSSG